MIGCAFAVLNTLGTGFLENALKVVFADAMHQLYQIDRPPALPAARFRQASPATKRVVRGLSTAPKPSALLSLQIAAACDEYPPSSGSHCDLWDLPPKLLPGVERHARRTCNLRRPVEAACNEASLPIKSNQAFNAKKQNEGREDREAGQ